VRVVAGAARGRRLVAPEGRDTRPTGDRVRQAVFNSLDSLGVVRNAAVVDLFAGSGALGIEALSRGAAHATFVETGRSALAAIHANLAATGLAAGATVVARDVLAFLERGAGPFDVALADPPYAFTDEDWTTLLDRLDAYVVVVESDREVELGARWHAVRARRYGSTMVTFGRRAEPEDVPEPEVHQSQATPADVVRGGPA
jgi:16S rRNA (guanine966-N2)-methyltransferase